MSKLQAVRPFDVFVFAHQEGNWLGSCLLSVSRAIEFAARNGIECAKSIIIRGSDQVTFDWIKEKAEGWPTIVLHGASLTDARNVACGLSNNSGLAAFIDGSDMIGEAWLHQAATALDQSTGICRPQALMTFGPDSFSWDGFEFILQPEKAPDEPAILKGDPYPSGFVATSDVLKTVRWPERNDRVGWGHEDWWWNCLTIENGVNHQIVEGAAHYRRMSVRAPIANKALRPGPIRKRREN
jgi:hypothetical protein